MPTFELVSIEEAQLELTLRGKRGALMREYIDYINSRQPGQAGKLTAGEGETTAAIRRRLGSAAQLIGKSLETTRDGDVVYFWDTGESPGTRRRGRRRRSG